MDTAIMNRRVIILSGACILALFFLVVMTTRGFRLAGRTGVHTVADAGVTDFTEDANCVAAWLMNSAPTETDRSGDGNTLDESAGDDIPTTNLFASGYSGTSRSFDDDDGTGGERLTLADASLSSGLEGIGGSTGNLSVVAWVFTFETSSQMIIGQFATTADRSWNLATETTGKLKVQFSTDGSADTDIETGNIMSTGVWHHTAFTWDGVDTIIYTGAVAVLTNAFAGTLHDSSGAFTIGAMFNGSEAIDAYIDEPAVFNRVLTPAEIGSIFTNGIDGANGGND